MNRVPSAVEVIVKFSAGAYQTNTVRGRRASSTISAGQAVSRLGKKLFGVEGLGVFTRNLLGTELWRIAQPETAEAAR